MLIFDTFFSEKNFKETKVIEIVKVLFLSFPNPIAFLFPESTIIPTQAFILFHIQYSPLIHGFIFYCFSYPRSNTCGSRWSLFWVNVAQCYITMHTLFTTSLHLIAQPFYHLTPSQNGKDEYSTISNFERKTIFTWLLLQYIVLIMLLYYCC